MLFASFTRPLIEGDAVVLVVEGEADEIPAVGRQAPAVEEQQRGALAAPVEIVEPHAVDDDVVVGGQDEFLDVEPGDAGRQAQVLQGLSLGEHRLLPCPPPACRGRGARGPSRPRSSG